MDYISEKFNDWINSLLDTVMFFQTLTKEEIEAYFQEKYENLQDFVLDMNYELGHDYLFMPAHYPFFFIAQAIFTCILIKKYNPKMDWLQSFPFGYLVLMLGRNIVGLITGMVPPTLQTPGYTFSYAIIWLLINHFPGDLIFKILKSFIFYIPLQIINALTSVRETTHGIDIGFRTFPGSIPGILGISFILSCTDSIVWNLCIREVREYSSWIILRNMIFAVVYLALTHYGEMFEFISLSREQTKIFELYAAVGLVLLDDVIFGLTKPEGLGNKLTKLLSYLPYHGDDYLSK